MNVAGQESSSFNKAMPSNEVLYPTETDPAPVGLELLESQFADSFIDLTVNIAMATGLLARWSPFSPYRYGAQDLLLGVTLEELDLVLLDKTIQAGLDRQDGMNGVIEPHHHIYDEFFGHSDYRSHAEFVDYLRDVAAIKLADEPIDESTFNQKKQDLYKFERLGRIVGDATFRHMTQNFVKTDSPIPLENYNRELALHYLDRQYWRDAFEQEVSPLHPAYLPSGEQSPYLERLEEYRSWVAQQYARLLTA